MALLSDMPRSASIYTKGKVKCLSLGRQEFDSMLGPLTDVLDRNGRIRILRTFPTFASKSNEALEHIVSQLEIKAFHDGQCIFRQGDTATAFFIVKSGCVKLIKKSLDSATGKTQTHEVLLKANDTFGSEVLEQLGTYTSTVISCGRSQCQRLKVSAMARSGSRQFTQVRCNSCCSSRCILSCHETYTVLFVSNSASACRRTGFASTAQSPWMTFKWWVALCCSLNSLR